MATRPAGNMRPATGGRAGPARSWQTLLVAILLLALALRLWLWSRPAHPLANDETEYFRVGMDLAQGRGFVFYDTYRWLRAPLYPLFLGLFFWLGQGHARLATLVQVLLSTATVYGFHLLGRRLFGPEAGPRAGLVAALLSALLLPLATFPSLFMAETLFTFLLVAFFLLLLQVPLAAPRGRWRWAAAAGLLLGLCALTRAVALAFLPLAATWLLVVLWRQGRAQDSPPSGNPAPGPPAARHAGRTDGAPPCLPPWKALLLPLLLGVTALAAIAPWTVRNAVVYRRFIPLDTGGAYSLWAFYEPHQDLDEINRTLEAIPNPADRQAYAVSQWRQRLREEPALLLRHLAETFPYLLRIKPIEDRFLPLPYREPEPLYFLLALLLDDGLYALIAVASLAALVLAPAGRGKTLALLWILYNIGVMAVLHAEARYRQLLFPALIPLAALALVQGRTWACAAWAQGSRLLGRALRLALLALLLAGWTYCFVAYSPWDWAALNVHRGFYQALGRANWLLGRGEAAVAAYSRALEVDGGTPDPYYDLGWALERLGRPEEAERAYRWCWGIRSNYLPCSTALGNILRQQGREEEARTAFRGRYVEESAVVAWAWENLAVPPAAQLDLGNGLDYGYVAGVHAAEEGGGVSFRWTTAQARLRLFPAQAGTARLQLRLAAPRLGEAPPAAVEVWLGGRRIGRWTAGPQWGTYETDPFTVPAGRPMEFGLRSTVFVPRLVEPASADTRALGVQVDWIAIGEPSP